MTTCQACGASVTFADSARGQVPLSPKPDPDGDVRVTPSRAVPGSLFAKPLNPRDLAQARARGEDLYGLHFDSCPGRRGR